MDRSSNVRQAPAGPPTVTDPAEQDLVIRLVDVSVRYRVPRERILSVKEYAIRRLRGRMTWQDFWALSAVSLTVGRGETIGIIGRNGAGKSTLLKVVARVLRPTQGRVLVKGRVVPLLELGAGFHPELSGRENVFLNAALLGHSRKEIHAAFPSITKFAELGGFIDAPLRTYSSGMVARLGYAIAVAWQADTLILDEILAVGDEAFQAKCREQLAILQRNGTTVLLVSHSTASVRELCQRAVWLENGRLQAVGPAETVTALYQSS